MPQERSFVRYLFSISGDGADGLMVEAHPNPINSISDLIEQYHYEFGEIVKLSRDAALYIEQINMYSVIIRTKNEEIHIGQAIQSCIDFEKSRNHNCK